MEPPQVVTTHSRQETYARTSVETKCRYIAHVACEVVTVRLYGHTLWIWLFYWQPCTIICDQATNCTAQNHVSMSITSILRSSAIFFLRKSTLWDLYPVFTLFQSSAAKDVPAKSLIFICQEVWIHDLYPLAWGVLIYSISWYFFYIQQLWLLFTLQHTTVITIQHSSKTRQVPRWVRDLNQKIHLRIDRLGPESEPTRLNRPIHGTSRTNSADSAELSPSQSRVKLSVVHP